MCQPYFSVSCGGGFGEEVAAAGLALSPFLALKYHRENFCLHPFVLALWNPIECLETSEALVVSLAKIPFVLWAVAGVEPHVYKHPPPLLSSLGRPPTPTATEEGRSSGGRLHGGGGWRWHPARGLPAQLSPTVPLATQQEGRAPPLLVWCACVPLAPLASSPGPPGGLSLGCFPAGTAYPAPWPELLSPPGFSKRLPREEHSREQTAPPHTPTPPAVLSVWPFSASTAMPAGGVALLWLGLCFVLGRLFVFWFFFFFCTDVTPPRK